MEIQDERIKNKTIELSQFQEEIKEKHFAWLKNIITLAVGLFGIIISFKGDKEISQIKHIFFIISISTLALGIISGIVVLYSEIHVMIKIKKIKGENILKMLNDDKVEKIAVVDRNKIYKYLEKICIVSFALAIISLVIYSAFN